MQKFDPAALLAPLDTFPRRHLGPTPFDIEHMVEVLDVDSLDALIDETVPANDPPGAAAATRCSAQRIRSAGRPAQPGRAQPGLPFLYRHGLLRHADARRHSAQHPGKPRLVHANTRPTRPRSPRAGSKRCSTSRRWSRT